MPTIKFTYTHMVGDFCIAQHDCQADVETSDYGFTGPFVSSVSSIFIEQSGGKLELDINSDDSLIVGLYRAIQEHCEQDEAILEAALREESDPRDTAADAKYREAREYA